MKNEKKTSKAQLEAVKKYDAKTYDIVTVKLHKGIKDRILAGNYSINGYINKVLNECMERDGL